MQNAIAIHQALRLEQLVTNIFFGIYKTPLHSQSDI